MKKRAYRTIRVKDVVLAEILKQVPEGQVWIGVDLGKKHLLAVLHGSDGEFARPWKIAQPDELRPFLDLLKELAAVRAVVVVLESTGTYGDALRQALHDAGVPVHRVRSQAAAKYAETFDGVPSQHDGKDAAVLADLGATGKSVLWPMPDRQPWEDQMHAEVQWMDAQQTIRQQWLGRLEAHLTRHWPEVLRLLSLGSGTLLKILMKFGGPAGLLADSEANVFLKTLCRGPVSAEKLRAIEESASHTMGVRMSAEDLRAIQRCAKAAWAARREIAAARKILNRIAREQKVLQQMAQAVGPATACVLYDRVGDPQKYNSAPAYRKAMGLNLREDSSGDWQGPLTITRRGPGIVRRWLYFAALRWVQRGPLKIWFAARKDPVRQDGKRLLVAVMRRLALAVHAVVVRGENFDPSRLFPGRSPTQKRRRRTREYVR